MTGHARTKRDSLSDSGGSDIMDLEEGILLETPLTKKQNCSTRYNNNISNTNVFTVETDVWFVYLFGDDAIFSVLVPLFYNESVATSSIDGVSDP